MRLQGLLLALGLAAWSWGAAGEAGLISKEDHEMMLKGIKAAKAAGQLAEPGPEAKASKKPSTIKRAVAALVGQAEPDANGSPAEDPVTTEEEKAFLEEISKFAEQEMVEEQAKEGSQAGEEVQEGLPPEVQQAAGQAVEGQAMEPSEAAEKIAKLLPPDVQQQAVEGSEAAEGIEQLLPPEVLQEVALMQGQGNKAKARMHRGSPQAVSKKARPSSRKMRGSSLVQVNSMGEAMKAVVEEDEQEAVVEEDEQEGISKAEEEEIHRRIKEAEEKHGNVFLEVAPGAVPERVSRIVAMMEDAKADRLPTGKMPARLDNADDEAMLEQLRRVTQVGTNDTKVHLAPGEDPVTPGMEKEFMENVAEDAEAHMTPEEQHEDEVVARESRHRLLPPNNTAH